MIRRLQASGADGPAVLLILAAFVAIVSLAILQNNAFGYDESVYAVRSRSWISEAPTSGWGVHRPPLVPVIGLVAALAGGDEWAFRLLGLLAGLGVLVVVWRFARSLGGRTAGILAVTAIASGAPFLVESSTFLTDVPSTALLLALTVGLWSQLASGRFDRSLVLLAPLAAAAFYTRYGAIVPLTATVAAGVVCCSSQLRTGWRHLAATAAVFLLLLVPHGLMATQARGVPWGIITLSQGAARSTSGVPLLDYVAWFPWSLLGPPGALVATAGIIGILRSLASTPANGVERRLAKFIGLSVALQLVVLGTVIHAEPRYVLFPMILLVVAGAATLSPTVDALTRSSHARRALGAVLGASMVLGAVVAQGVIADRARYWDWKRDAGVYIEAQSLPPDCSALAADVPIITWYSGCRTFNFALDSGSNRLRLLTGTSRWLVLAEEGAHQPSDDTFGSAYRPNLAPAVKLTDGLGRQAATVFRVVDDLPSR